MQAQSGCESAAKGPMAIREGGRLVILDERKKRERISMHGQDENTPPNSRIVTILCWINFGTIARTQFRFRGGGRGAALTPLDPRPYQDPPWVAA